MGQGAVKRRKEETKVKRKARNIPDTSTSKSDTDSTSNPSSADEPEAATTEATDEPAQVAEDFDDKVPNTVKSRTRKGKASGGTQRINKDRLACQASSGVKALLERIALNDITEQTEDELDVDSGHSSAMATDVDEIDLSATDDEEVVEVIVTKPVGKKRLVASQAKKSVEKVAKVMAEGSESNSDNAEDISFKYTMEMSNMLKGSRTVAIISSSTAWSSLEQQLAEAFDIYPMSLQAQYRFSTESKDALPCDLTSQRQLDTLLTRLRPLVVPQKLPSGRISSRQMKPVTVQVFNKGDEPTQSDNKRNKLLRGVRTSIEKEKQKSEGDVFHEKKVVVWKAITEIYMCLTHSLPNKPVLCWKDSVHNGCYPITENNLNLWATLVIREPEKYTIDKKLQEINVYSNAPHTRAPGQHLAAPQPPAGPPVGFPYSYYPSPYYPPPPAWYGQPGPPTFNLPPLVPNQGPVPNPDQPAPAKAIKIEYPKIIDWLEYCDRHPDRCGEDFSAHASKFDKEGFRHLNQLTAGRITVETDWLEIGKGTADLLIGHAEEDVELIKAGNFTMMLDDETFDIHQVEYM